MKQYKVLYRDDVGAYLKELALIVSQQTSQDFAERYIQRLRSEVEELSFLAPILPKSKYHMPLRFNKDAKTMPIGKRKLTVIFHIDGEYVIVDKILPSCMITH